MEIEDDFKELLARFHSNRVEYVIVGAYALAAHGVPRYTGDIDLYVRPTAANAARVWRALQEFGFGNVGLAAADFEVSGQVIQLGVPPVRIDVLTSVTGVTWEDIDAGAVGGEYGGVPVRFMGRDELVKNKLATGRAKDLGDVEELGKLRDLDAD